MEKIKALVYAYPKVVGAVAVALALLVATGFYNYDWSASVAYFW